MQLLASDLITDDLLARLAHVSEDTIRNRQHLSFFRWMAEFRTFSLGLARQTHKTTTLIRHLDEQSIMIVHNQREADRLNKLYPHELPQIFSPYGFVEFAERRIHGTGRKISRIFMDELDLVSPNPASVYTSIELLQLGRYLTDNVFILKVGTPVR